MRYDTEEHGDKGRVRHGSPTFYNLLHEMAETHDRKSHDYASDTNPAGNYHFAGEMALLFAHSPQDAGFIGRLAEKIYRIANIERSQKEPQNETVADTERDIAVITALWMSDRRDRRNRAGQFIGNKEMSPIEKASEDAECKIIEVANFLTNTDLTDSIAYLQAVQENRRLHASRDSLIESGQGRPNDTKRL